jgi:hypothetical protein
MQFWTDSFLPGKTHAAPVTRLIAGRTLSSMVDQSYLVTMRPPSHAIQQVFAATAEVRGSHLVFVDAKGNLAALFLRELVESWNVLPTKMAVRGASPLCPLEPLPELRIPPSRPSPTAIKV